MKVWINVILVLLAIEDIRTRKVSLWFLLIALLLSAIYGLRQHSYLQCLLGLLPGIGLVLLAWLQKETIGIGDGLIAMSYGMLYGWKHTCLWLLFSFLLVAVVGVFWKVVSKKRKIQMPFIPFMAVVHMGMSI